MKAALMKKYCFEIRHIRMDVRSAVFWVDNWGDTYFKTQIEDIPYGIINGAALVVREYIKRQL